jgi:hypothetical protein
MMLIYFRIVVALLDVLLGLALLAVLYRATHSASPSEPDRRRRRAGEIFITVGGLVLVLSGSMKILHIPLVVSEMTSLNMAGWKIYMVGGLEVLSGLIFLTRRLRSVGIPLASAYLGAAVSAHVQSGQYFAVMPTFFIMGCCWLGAALRYPQLLWSLSAGSRTQHAQSKNLTPEIQP